MRIAVVGAGAVGARAARQLVSAGAVAEVALRDPDAARARAVAESLGESATVDGGSGLPDADVVVLAGPAGSQLPVARELVRAGRSVVSTSDDLSEVEGLLALDHEATERGALVVAGASFAPGLTCVLARHAASTFDMVEEIHVARVGTGGAACAHQHHRALSGTAVDWRDGGWVRRRSGSGRELVWFPDPISGRDCYRAALPDALLLVAAFPSVQRITARQAANRRDRLTSRLPMLLRPPPEGGPGAVRVEVRGTRTGGGRDVRVLGCMDHPAAAAGAVAALAAQWVGEGRMTGEGTAGLARLADPVPFLEALRARGVKAAVFEGAGIG